MADNQLDYCKPHSFFYDVVEFIFMITYLVTPFALSIMLLIYIAPWLHSKPRIVVLLFNIIPLIIVSRLFVPALKMGRRHASILMNFKKAK